MKIFISADIEGVATTTTWIETDPSAGAYVPHAKEMTQEVLAACNAAIEAGADEIVVRDAHGSGTNIDTSPFPACVKFIRGWEGHPYMMVQGIDSSFDGAMFIGYHAAAGSIGSPMCHTMTLKTQKITINGKPCSEFLLYSYCAALEGVPAIFLSGDKAICEDGSALYPWLVTAPVKEGIGNSTYSVCPVKAQQMISDGVKEAIKVGLGHKPQLPEHFVVDLTYRDHTNASSMSYFPGAVRVDSHTVRIEDDDFFEIARKLKFML